MIRKLRIAVDHGNKNMKTCNQVFTTALLTQDTTKKQIVKILTLEGGIYALISTLLIMTFGNAFLLLVARAVPNMVDYAVFEYPVALVIGLIAAIFVICLSVPAIVYKAISDETVIERLRNFDN